MKIRTLAEIISEALEQFDPEDEVTEEDIVLFI